MNSMEKCSAAFQLIGLVKQAGQIPIEAAGRMAHAARMARMARGLGSNPRMIPGAWTSLVPDKKQDIMTFLKTLVSRGFPLGRQQSEQMKIHKLMAAVRGTGTPAVERGAGVNAASRYLGSQTGPTGGAFVDLTRKTAPTVIPPVEGRL